MAKAVSLSLTVLLLLSTLAGCLSNEYKQFVNYDIDEAQQFWQQYDEHQYEKRTPPTSQTVEIADNLVNNNEIFLLRYWDSYVYDEDNLDWSEDPYDDETWVFYFHSLRMVSFLVNAYELTNDTVYIEKAQWFIESWMEHNPNPYNNSGTRFAWGDHSTANRIITLTYFWDYYRDSSLFDEEFANEFLNMLNNHGIFTAQDKNYSWGINHGIYQDRALMQLAVLFPIFESSDEWLEISISRLSLHLNEDVTLTGVHKEHSTSYHYLVMGLFMSISKFANHYGISIEELDSTIYKMQEYLVHLSKADGTTPLIGDSTATNLLGMNESQIINEHLLYVVSDGDLGVKNEQDSSVYVDAGVALFKNDWDVSPAIYFALFNRFHMVTKHKQCDDLSFVLTYQDTDYFVDSGKYNYDERDPYRILMRSVFAHNTIAVGDESYDIEDSNNIGTTAIEHYGITSEYSYVKASHSMYDGVKISRTVIFFNEGAVYFHDQIESDENHKYTQIFNIGQDVIINDSNQNNVILSSMIDNSSLTLTQLNSISEFESYNGSNDPVRGWQSTTFNEVTPITTLNFLLEGNNVAFETVINLGLEIADVDNFQDSGTNVYVITFDDNRTERIEIG
ncbi:MAG: hypothetical protein HOE92_05670 [Euryarchaeota archaeon]|nr:hypothetical protein [Euryarchaeota archaeon]MBT3971687.1 hypothetical protein [Euryarchaeota archaeon]MBT4406821.1 hypothetical protein [Euryarchaeota archaeon]MBT6645841.1 hypothetical protein [Euryarchaeota archaeon]